MLSSIYFWSLMALSFLVLIVSIHRMASDKPYQFSRSGPLSVVIGRVVSVSLTYYLLLQYNLNWLAISILAIMVIGGFTHLRNAEVYGAGEFIGDGKRAFASALNSIWVIITFGFYYIVYFPS